MSGNKPASGGNTAPLVEFIQMLSDAKGREARPAFPRRQNSHIAAASLPITGGDVFLPEVGESKVERRVKAAPRRKETVRMKRSKSPAVEDIRRTRFVRSPFACEILTKSSKGIYSSTYVDIDLSTLGLEPLLQGVHVTRNIGKRLIGVSCCYLRLGTALVVSGCVVEVNVADSTAQVVPDSGLCLDVEWVSLKKLYSIPEDITEVRRIVSERVYTVLQEEAESTASGIRRDFLTKDS